MKYDKNNTELQTSIQAMSLSDLGDYLRKREGSFNVIHRHEHYIIMVHSALYRIYLLIYDLQSED